MARAADASAPVRDLAALQSSADAAVQPVLQPQWAEDRQPEQGEELTHIFLRVEFEDWLDDEGLAANWEPIDDIMGLGDPENPEFEQDIDAYNEATEAVFEILSETYDNPSEVFEASDILEVIDGNDAVINALEFYARRMAEVEEDDLDRDRADWGVVAEQPEQGGVDPEDAEMAKLMNAIEAQSQAKPQEQEDDAEMEDLIRRMNQLRISETPFHSDADEGAEEHSVFARQADLEIMVASNPKPLKEITSAAHPKWAGVNLPPPVVVQLKMLRKQAKLKLYTLAGKKKTGKYNITGARTKKNFTAFRKSLLAIAGVFASLKSNTGAAMALQPTNLSGDNYGNNSGNTEGKYVKADPLSINTMTAGSKPSKDGRLMKSIRTRAGKHSKSYVQMHLLNDLVFGPGQLWNMTPGPKQSNSDMEKKIETPLKSAVLGKGLMIQFEATVNYKSDPMAASLKDIQQAPDKYRFNTITFKAKEYVYDHAASKWQLGPAQDSDVKAINGTIHWRYGGLPPLTPKPRILHPATTAAELEAVGIQPTAAARIVAYVSTKGPIKIGGPRKQQQLANRVKAWDKKASIPNISSWKATAVLWT